MKLSHHWTVMLGTTSLLAMAHPAFAQEQAVAPQAVAPQAGADTSRGLEEIVVTARRRTESLINVPVAVSALSAAAIERAHVSDVTQIGEMTPNLMIASASGGGGGTIAIRGVGSSYLDPGIEQSVGINIDGVSVGRGRFILASQFDIQQVEVLKGPQALFFGKNSPAGVISITSADPTRDLSAMARVGYEFEAKERYAEAYISGPVTDNLLFRVAGKYSKMDGWIKNVTVAAPNLASPGFPTPGPTSDEGPAGRSYSGRVTLKWEPTSNFSANLKLSASQLKGNGDDGNVEPYCVPSTGKVSILALGLGAYVTDPQSDCKLNKKKAVGAIPTAFLANWPEAKNGRTYNVLDTYLGSLTLNYDFGNVTLTSVSGYTKLIGKNLGNYDLTSFGAVYSAQREAARTYSQEFRLISSFDGPVNFTLGSFYENAKRSNKFKPILGFVGFDPANGGSAYTFEDLWKNSGKTYSAYGQARWSIVQGLELAGGVRYTKEKKDTTGEDLYLGLLGGAFGLAPVGQVVARKLQFSNWSPEITLSYKPQQNLMTYIAYKTGYKSGGLSTPATISLAYVNDPSLLAFKPERSKGFEAGVKGEILDRTVRFDMNIYRYTFSDLQLTSFNPALVAYFIKNAGKARTSGVEASAQWRATHELTLNGQASYTKAKYVSFLGAQCYSTLGCGPTGSYDRSGQRLARAPKLTFTGGFDYVTEISSTMKIGVGGDAVYTSSFETSELGNPAGHVDGFWRLNASVRLGTIDDKWELALLGRNLTDKYYFLVSNDKVLSPAGNYGAYTQRPRQIALQGTMKF